MPDGVVYTAYIYNKQRRICVSRGSFAGLEIHEYNSRFIVLRRFAGEEGRGDFIFKPCFVFFFGADSMLCCVSVCAAAIKGEALVVSYRCDRLTIFAEWTRDIRGFLRTARGWCIVAVFSL